MSTPIYDALNEKLTIEALDWEHVPACEHPQHVLPGEPAQWAVRTTCCNFFVGYECSICKAKDVAVTHLYIDVPAVCGHPWKPPNYTPINN